MPDPHPSTASERPPRGAAPGIGLSDLLDLLRADPSLGTAELRGAAEGVQVTGAGLDSRRVRPGDLYAGLSGAHVHGARFAAQAQAAGAVAVLTDVEGARLAAEAGCTLPCLVVDDPRGVLGGLSAAVHHHPARRLAVIGVTGTNGKTTTATLVHGALTALGRTAGLIGTIETRIGTEATVAVRTTPESPDLHALLARMVRAGVQACAMEVSSHALSLHRVDGATFDVVAFTNLSQDHLDFHATMQEYYAAKASLFDPSRAVSAVICVDDDWGRQLAGQVRVPVVTLASHPGTDADWTVTERGPDPAGEGSRFTLTDRAGHPWQLRCPLPGDFNVTNTALAALILGGPALGHLGLTPEQVADGLAAAGGVPGRMEVVTAGPAPGVAGSPVGPLGVVDYAHGPDSIAAALAALRRTGADPLVVVLGAGGDRDPGKRHNMGVAAAQGADLVVVTDDNPRSEDAAQIRAEVLGGAHKAQQEGAAHGRRVDVVEVPGRREAIAAGVRLLLARAGGSAAGRGAGRPTLLLAGKGHETGQEIAGVVHPFDDRVELRAALKAASGEKETGA